MALGQPPLRWPFSPRMRICVHAAHAAPASRGPSESLSCCLVKSTAHHRHSCLLVLKGRQLGPGPGQPGPGHLGSTWKRRLAWCLVSATQTLCMFSGLCSGGAWLQCDCGQTGPAWTDGAPAEGAPRPEPTRPRAGLRALRTRVLFVSCHLGKKRHGRVALTSEPAQWGLGSLASAPPRSMCVPETIFSNTLSERNFVPKSQSLNTFPQSLVFNS